MLFNTERRMTGDVALAKGSRSDHSLSSFPATMIYSCGVACNSSTRCAGDLTVMVRVASTGAVYSFESLHRAVLMLRCQYFERIVDQRSDTWTIMVDSFELDHGDIQTFWALVYMIDALQWQAFWKQASKTLLPLQDMQRFLRLHALALILGFDALVQPIQDLVLKTMPWNVLRTPFENVAVEKRAQYMLQVARMCYEAAQPDAERWALHLLVWTSAFIVTREFRDTWSIIARREMGVMFNDPAVVLVMRPETTTFGVCCACIHRTTHGSSGDWTIRIEQDAEHSRCVFLRPHALEHQRIACETYNNETGLQQHGLENRYKNHQRFTLDRYEVPKDVFEESDAHSLCTGPCSLCRKSTDPVYVFFISDK